MTPTACSVARAYAPLLADAAMRRLAVKSVRTLPGSTKVTVMPGATS
jgi:hypothetical protein